jgi:enamine deaminase RidA (YjgF/YER057c/UK114 family)
MTRHRVTAGSPLEQEIGFTRAVRAGAWIAVSGTAPIAPEGGTAAPGDLYGQTRRCLDIIRAALEEAGGSLADVVRTRVMLTDTAQWREAARAHREAFGAHPPASTFVQVTGFLDPAWLVEIEADARLD